MGKFRLTIHGNLVDFLPREAKSTSFELGFSHKTAVKHPIESLGVPHPEIGRVELNHQRIDFDYSVQDGDDIHVYPYSPGEGWPGETPPRFILDNHLGKLADYLRLLGFDVIYAQKLSDEDIARSAEQQNRILLTRDRGLLKRKIVRVGHCVRADNPVHQLREVVSLYNLETWITPFQRCPRCNGKLNPVEKQEIIQQLLPLTRQYYDEFTRCAQCGQIYWKGSHFENMLKLFAPYISTPQDTP